MPILTSHDDTELWYELAGEGNPLVVLAGGPGMDARYLGDLGGLTAHRTLVLLDGRAAGRSAVPADRSTVSFLTQARDLEALRLHLGLERLDLLAHSAGTLVAQEYAAAHPGRVRRAVLVTPVGRAAREPDPAELAALRAARSAEPWYPGAAEADRRLAEGAGAAEAPLLQARTLPFSWHHWDSGRLAEYRAEHACRHPWLRDAFYAGSSTDPGRLRRLAASGLSALVLAGASDGQIGTAPARAVAACHPGARLEVMAASGHRPWVEEPGRFVMLATEFLGNAP
ncbi:alpha/beta fold hydrolase [Kitasatospora sp. NPDC004240]